MLNGARNHSCTCWSLNNLTFEEFNSGNPFPVTLNILSGLANPFPVSEDVLRDAVAVDVGGRAVRRLAAQAENFVHLEKNNLKYLHSKAALERNESRVRLNPRDSFLRSTSKSRVRVGKERCKDVVTKLTCKALKYI
jgi:hypothetical protein